MKRSPNRGFLDIRVHGNLHPDNAIELACDSIAGGSVPTRLLYESPTQARAWRELAADLSPASDRSDGVLAYAEVHSLLSSLVAKHPTELQIIGVGCGDCAKEAALANELVRKGPVTSTPIDVSLPLIQVAASNLERLPNCHVNRPLVVDLEGSDALRGHLPRSTGCRVVTLYGVLPWMDPAGVGRLIPALLEPGDWLCLSANLASEGSGGLEELLSQYDNAPTRRWIQLLLEKLGVGDRHEDLNFKIESSDAPGFHSTVIGFLENSSGLDIDLEGVGVHVDPGVELEVFRSTRHRSRDLEALCDSAGLQLERVAISPSAHEGVALARLG